MARTKASVGAKLSSGKSSKAVKTSGSTPSRNTTATPSTSKGHSSSGNPYHPRPTPKWQKPITKFFGEPSETTHSDQEDIASGSKGRPRYTRQITSDTESDVDGPEGEDLDASIISNVDLPPLSPDDKSHKIVEYFDKAKSNGSQISQSIKGKGKGKRSVQIDENNSTDGDDDNTSKSNDNLGNGNSSQSEDKENLSTCNLMSKEKNREGNLKAEKREADSIELKSAKRVKVVS